MLSSRSPAFRSHDRPEHRLRQLVLCLIVSTSTSMTSADLAWQWTLKMDRDFRGNPSVPVECTFEQQRTELTVKCGTANATGEMKGQVRGRSVTWGLEKTGIPPIVEDRLILTVQRRIERFRDHGHGRVAADQQRPRREGHVRGDKEAIGPSASSGPNRDVTVQCVRGCALREVNVANEFTAKPPGATLGFACRERCTVPIAGGPSRRR